MVTRSKLFVSLDELSKLTSEKARALGGGKAMNLAALHRHGFKTPQAFVVPTNVFDDEVLRALCGAQDLSDPRDVVAHLEFSDGFMESLRLACRVLNCPLFAIRSSATDEDDEDHSFAGLLESEIGVTSEGCADAIRRVWSSFYARERVMFPSQSPLDGPIPSMAVLVQECIESDVAGVVFTKHPLDGESSVLINVTRGEGELVVSGKGGESVTVKKYLVENGSANELPTCVSLKPEEMRDLVQVALNVERAFGAPQDIEFVFSKGQLYLLQTRAIASNADCNAPKNHLFSNVNVGEALSGVCSPLTWSIGMSYAQHGFDTLFHAAGLSVPPNYTFVTTFFGHIYLNVSQILSLCTQIPFVGREKFGKAAGIAHISDYVCDVEKLSRAKFISQLPVSIFRILKTQRRVKAFDAHAAKFCAWRDRFMASRFDTVDSLKRAYNELYAAFIECGDDMLAAGMSALVSYFFVSTCVNRVSERDAAELETYLFCKLMNVQSAAPGLELQSIAQFVSHYKTLSERFKAADFSTPTSPTLFLNSIMNEVGGAEFCTRFNAFLVAYGSRANQEAELANPRWREDPRFLFQVIQSHLKAEGAPHSATSDDLQQKALDEFEKSLFPVNRVIFNKLLNMARGYTKLRELGRAYVVDSLASFRHFALSCAEIMLKNGLIAQKEDVFFLTLTEIRQWLFDPASLANARLRVAFRRARHAAFLSAQSLPCTFTRHPNSCANSDPCSYSKQLRGLPASPGCVKARVRVIRDLATDAASLEYGEIIVATSTDVGWTPLFLLASAILTEQGGPLSHAFVVAREYGIPAVVSIPNLLASLHTGDIVTVQASKGVVLID